MNQKLYEKVKKEYKNSETTKSQLVKILKNCRMIQQLKIIDDIQIFALK